MKYLLDTNVWRSLAAGDLRATEPCLLEARNRGQQFFFADLSLVEIVRTLPTDRSSFTRVHKAIGWLDTLAGNRGLAERSPLPLRIGLFRTPPPLKDDRTEVNRLRRCLLHATSPDSIPEDDIAGLRHWAQQLEAQQEEWVANAERAQDIQRGRTPVPPSELRPEDAKRAPEDVVADRLIEILLSQSDRDVYPSRPHAEIRSELREFLHYHAGQIAKSGNKAPYNYRKHRSDYIDLMLLSFCAAGYTLVTLDTGISGTLTLGNCPDPRVVSLIVMVDSLQKDAATSGQP